MTKSAPPIPPFAMQTGTAGNDWMFGVEQPVMLFGLAGHDTLRGGSGDDTLQGGEGNDFLYDAGGANSLVGGAGDDRIVLNGAAAAGSSTLVGGEGRDTFAFYANRVAGLPVILDFTPGPGGDILDLASVFGGRPLGTYPNDIFPIHVREPGTYSGGNPFGAAGYLRLLQDGEDCLLQWDADGAVGSSTGWLGVVRLAGVQAAALVAENFTAGLRPDGLEPDVLLTGSARADTLAGTVGHDTLAGMAGDDVLSGAWGDDSIDGGEGADILHGDEGNDTLIGGAGSDRNTLFGGAGNDSLVAGNGGDSLFGGTQDDRLVGGTGADRLFGEEGNDVLLSGSALSTLYGGAGNDRLVGVRELDGGDGNDLLDATAATQTASLSGGMGNDTLRAGSGNDFVLDDGGSNLIEGGAGNDFFNIKLASATDRSTVSGGEGRDVFRLAATPEKSPGLLITDFQTGADGDVLDCTTLLGGMYAAGGNPFGVRGFLRLVQEGADTLLQGDRDGAVGPAAWTTLVRLQGVALVNLVKENFLPSLPLSGSDTGVLLTGTDGDDRLQGNALDDTLLGGAGNDIIYGGSGNNSLDGGLGRDLIFGGGGNDRINAGQDDTAENYLNGDGGNDSITGGDGKDWIYTLEGDDTIVAGAGDDQIVDLGGSNRIDAGPGNDEISVLAQNPSGVTHVRGGSGSDRYLFNSQLSVSIQRDLRIEDFAAGAGGDRLDIVDLIQPINWSSPAGPLDPEYIGNPFGSAARLRLLQDGEDTLFQWDADGPGMPAPWATLARLEGVRASTLTTDNFSPQYPLDGHMSGLVLNGGAADARLAGKGGDDILTGGSGNETLKGGQGDDMLDGGSGQDAAEYTGMRKDFVLERLADGLGVRDLKGVEGRDSLMHIEDLAFSDFHVRLDMDAVAASIPPATLRSICKLYFACFDRVPDAEGLAYWIGQYRAGMSLDGIAANFLAVATDPAYPVPNAVHGGMNDADFVRALYANGLGRDNVALEDLVYWTGRLSGPQAMSRATLVNTLMDAAELVRDDPVWGAQVQLLDNKFAIARYFAITQGLGYAHPLDQMTRGAEILAAVTPFDTAAAIEIIGVHDLGWSPV